MNWAQNLFVYEQVARIRSQSSHDDSCCYFADHKIATRVDVRHDKGKAGSVSWTSATCLPASLKQFVNT